MAQSTANRVYENYEPPSDWVQDEGSETLILMLPGFRRDQLKVQVTSTRILKISGERQMGENKWRRFSKEFPLASDVDTNEIGAKFEGGLLYVKLPKANNPQEPTPEEVPKPQQQPKAEAPPTQKPDQQKAPQEVTPPKSKEDKLVAKAREFTQKIAQKKKEENDAKEKSKIEADANKVAQKREKGNTEAEANKEAQKKEKSTNGLGEEAKATTSKAQEKHETVGGLGQGEAEVDKRLPTRVLRLNSIQQYKEALVGLIVVVKEQSKLTNLIVAILLVLVLGLYVKNAIKSYSGGAKIQEL